MAKAKTNKKTAKKRDLKETLKSWKLKQDTINTFIGLVAVVVFGFIALNYFTSRNEVEVDPPVGNEQAESSDARTHTVAEGEGLWQIAETYYDDGFKWTEIAEVNNIDDPNLIEAGQVIVIPELPTGSVAPTLAENITLTLTPTQSATPTTLPTLTVTVEPTDTVTPTATATPTPQITKMAVSDEVPDDRIHTVAKGEGLWQIAERYFKSGYNWVDIARENSIERPYTLFVGQKVVLPEVEAKTQTTDGKDTATEISGATYKVQKGDTLWSIAVRAYGDGYKWSDIASENNLENPNLIEPDQEIKLPR